MFTFSDDKTHLANSALDPSNISQGSRVWLLPWHTNSTAIRPIFLAARDIHFSEAS